MNIRSSLAWLAIVGLGVGLVGSAITFASPPITATAKTSAVEIDIEKKPVDADRNAQPPTAQPMAPFIEKALDWLAEAQHENGGWGAGSNSNQQLRDPSKVQTDPATTAFSALAFLRAGSNTTGGPYRETVSRATNYLLQATETAPPGSPSITSLKGTQIQVKLGTLVDTSLTAHFLARLLPTLEVGQPLTARVDKALDLCLNKLQSSQRTDGSWNTAGWAPVLQSSLGCSALELAQAAGKKISQETLERAREYQAGNYDSKTQKADAKAAAGVELYAFASSQRASAPEAREANDLIEDAVGKGRLQKNAEVSADNLRKLGITRDKAESLARAYSSNQLQLNRIDDEALLKGFGNNGGEEYLSYMLTSESLVLAGGEKWRTWNDKMHQRLEKIQNPGGAWTGHHCITSPVFCTAAVIQCLTADRDAETLARLAAPETQESNTGSGDKSQPENQDSTRRRSEDL